MPGLELQHPVRKDTVNVPTGGYVVVRIKADNPGLWSMHCHVALHMLDGMFMLLNESYPNHPPPPPGFRTCGDFRVPYPGKVVSRSSAGSEAGVGKSLAGSSNSATSLAAAPLWIAVFWGAMRWVL